MKRIMAYVLFVFSCTTGMHAQELMPHWVIRESEHIMFYFEDTTYFDTIGMNAEAYIAAHEATYKQLNRFFQVPATKKITLCVWGNLEKGKLLLGRLPGFALPRDFTIHARFGQSFGHELTHVLSHWAWGQETINRSKFLNEGLAVTYDGYRGDKFDKARSHLKFYKYVVEKYNIRSIADIWQLEYEMEVAETLLYSVAGAFITYLLENSDFHEFKSCIKDQSLEHAYLVYGHKKLDSLFDDFDKLVGLETRG